MSIRTSLFCAASLAMLGAFSSGANAAPLGAQSTNPAADNGSTIEKAYYGRRCWRHRGAWVCRRYGYRYGYAPYYGYNSYGWGGPSLGFYFGGGGRGWHGGGHGFHGGHHGHRR